MEGLELLGAVDLHQVQANEATFTAAISACEGAQVQWAKLKKLSFLTWLRMKG